MGEIINKLIGFFKGKLSKPKKQEIDLKSYDDNIAQVDALIKEKFASLKEFNNKIISNESLSNYWDKELEALKGRVVALLKFVDDIEFCDSISEVIKFIRLSAIFRVVCVDTIQKSELDELKQFHKDVRLILIHAALKYGNKIESSILWDGAGFVFTEGMTDEDKKYAGLAYQLMRINTFVNEPTKNYSFNLRGILTKLKVERLCASSQSEYLFK